MIEGLLGTIALGFDGFFVCLGLGVLAPRRFRMALALAFGVCDAAASVSGALFGELLPQGLAFEWPRLLALCVAAAAAVALVASRPPTPRRRAVAWFCLPLLASWDNFVLGARAPGSVLFVDALGVALASAALAYCGLGLGGFLRDQRWAGAAARGDT